MKFMMCTIFSMLLFGEAMAGMVSTLRDVGFSNNGRYFAFTTTEDDGMSGMTCRTTTFINTVHNQWVGRPYRICKFSEDDYGPDKSREMRQRYEQSRREIARLTKKLKINFKNNGKRVVYREAFRFWKHSNVVKKEFTKKGESITFAANGGNRYRLQLNKQAVSSAKCKNMMVSDPPTIMSLQMRNLQTNQSLVLQADRGIPNTRGCPYHYRIQNVYTHKRGRNQVIVALLQYFTPSIEGPDERYLAISGRMN